MVRLLNQWLRDGPVGSPTELFRESIGDMNMGFRLNYGDKIASCAAEAAGLWTSDVRLEGVNNGDDYSRCVDSSAA